MSTRTLEISPNFAGSVVKQQTGACAWWKREFVPVCVGEEKEVDGLPLIRGSEGKGHAELVLKEKDYRMNWTELN